MGNNEMPSNDGIKVQGFIEVELVNKVDNVRRVYRNTITKGGKQFLLGHSASQILNMSGSMRGNSVVHSNILNTKDYSNYTSNYYYSEDCLTNMLLNIDTLKESLTESSSFINLFDSTGLVDSKVVGYANNNVSPVKDGKEGTIDYCKDEYVADGFTVCERWKYPEGVASGTIDTIVMGTGSISNGYKGTGQRFSKCIDKVNVQDTNFVSKSNGFMIPGIAGFTGNDEILLNYDQDGVSKHKHNITTGVITDNPEKFAVFGRDTNSVIQIGDYIYALDISRRITVYLASDMSMVSSFSVDGGFPGIDFCRLFKDKSNNLWVTATNTNTSSYGNVLCKVNNNGTYFHQAGGYFDNYDSIVTLPSGWDTYDVLFTSCGDYNVALIKDIKGTYYTGIVFTDTTNIVSSIVDIIPKVCQKSVLFKAGTKYGIIELGEDNYASGYIDTITMNRVINNNSGEKVIKADGGVYLTLNGWYSTIFSFVKLTQPIVKSDTDIMYVSYGYKIV